MDTLAHALYGTALVAGTRDEKKMFAAAVMGVLPDVIVYVTSFIQYGDIFADNIPLYRSTHSLVAAAIIASGLLIFKRKWLIFALPYLLHLLLDVFTHCGLYSTRLLFPFSDIHYCGLNYGASWWMWEANYGILVGIYYLIYWKFYKPYLTNKSN